jgi:hypothetical protein
MNGKRSDFAAKSCDRGHGRLQFKSPIEAVRPCVEALLAQGFHAAPDLLDQVLSAAGEGTWAGTTEGHPG